MFHKNYADELPDIIISDYLDDTEFGEDMTLDEHRIINDYLGSRFCTITLEDPKGDGQAKKPSKKNSQKDVDSYVVAEEEETKHPRGENTNFKTYFKQMTDAFESKLLALGGPMFRPVLFFVHPERKDTPEDSRLKLKSTQPNYKNIFPTQVLNNLVANLKRDNPYCAKLTATDLAKPFCLKQEFSLEDAFVELLHCNKVEPGTWKASEFADHNEENWQTVIKNPQSTCMDSKVLILEFACVFPENLYSTVYLSCRCCRVGIQTEFNSGTWVSVKRDLLCNIAFARSKAFKETTISESIFTLPSRIVRVKDFYLVTSVIGATPLVKKNPKSPSVFVRCCMYINNASYVFLSEFLHGRYKSAFEFIPAE